MNVRVLFLAVVFSVAALAQEEITLYPTPAGNRELHEGERLCGDYFVIREGGGKQWLVFNIGVSRVKTVFWMSFPMSVIAIAVVEGTKSPVAQMVFSKKGIKKVRIQLSHADYETARDCLPAPRTKK
jgi:hypothetical protein